VRVLPFDRLRAYATGPRHMQRSQGINLDVKTLHI
jgi:hypothetical protein